MSTARRMFGALAVSAAIAALGLLVPAGAEASGLPSDPAAHGYLGFCGPDGRQVTSGYVDVAPFVWKAVSSVPAPNAFTGRGQNADLVIVQPRSGVPAAYWSGDTLTAASFYSTTAHPTAQATAADIALETIVHEFPPTDSGLYVLRMDVARAGYGDYSATYPTATIRVAGNRWTEVSGGSVDCGAARAVSQETVLGSASKVQSSPAYAERQAAHEIAETDHQRGRAGRPAPANPSSASAVSGKAGPSGAAYRDAAAATSDDSLSGGDVVLIAVGAVVLLLIGAVGTRHFRRRTS